MFDKEKIPATAEELQRFNLHIQTAIEMLGPGQLQTDLAMIKFEINKRFDHRRRLVNG